MDRETFAGTVLDYKQRTPFRPFTVVTVAGSRHEVDRPEVIAVRGGVALDIAAGDIPVIFSHDGVSEVVGDLAGRPVEA